MFEGVREQFQGELDEIATAGLGKQERVIASAQGAHVTLSDGNVVWLDQPLASKVLADLQRGQNPPPSWK